MFESSFSGGKFDLLQKIGERRIETVECALRSRRSQRREGAGRSERPGIEPRVEHGDLCAGVGDAISMAVGHAVDEAVEPEAAETSVMAPARYVAGSRPCNCAT